MTPKKNVAVDPEIYEQFEQLAAETGKTVDELANDAMRAGIDSGTKWQRRVGAPRDYAREMAEAQSDEEAIQIADDAVQEHRAEQRGR